MGAPQTMLPAPLYGAYNRGVEGAELPSWTKREWLLEQEETNDQDEYGTFWENHTSCSYSIVPAGDGMAATSLSSR
jgi:hypothetical protein